MSLDLGLIRVFRTKVALISQSDFSLPSAPARDYAIPRKYDFTYSGSVRTAARDGQKKKTKKLRHLGRGFRVFIGSK